MVSNDIYKSRFRLILSTIFVLLLAKYYYYDNSQSDFTQTKYNIFKELNDTRDINNHLSTNIKPHLNYSSYDDLHNISIPKINTK